MTDNERPPVGTRHQRVGWDTPEGLDEAMIRAVVERFYADARRDPVVGPVFNRVIAEVWSSMLLGSGRYAGRPMPKHMAIPELSDSHFRRWLALFRRTVEDLCPPAIAELFIERSERIGNSFRMNIAMRRGQDITTMGPLERETPVWSPPRSQS
jgi:hemoglobin